MNLVKIESHVDVSRPEQVEALNQFLKALNPDGVQAENAKENIFAKKLKETKEQTKAASSKKVEAEEVGVETLEKGPGLGSHNPDNPEPEETHQPIKTEEPAVTIEQIRELVTDKAAKHREAIKAELSRLDAPNVTKLDKKHFPEFHEFLTGLK